MRKKQVIRLTEGQLRRIVSESVRKMMNEVASGSIEDGGKLGYIFYSPEEHCFDLEGEFPQEDEIELAVVAADYDPEYWDDGSVIGYSLNEIDWEFADDKSAERFGEYADEIEQAFVRNKREIGDYMCKHSDDNLRNYMR